MSVDDRPLPTPPRSRFGRPLPQDETAGAPLTADRLAQAAAEGRLEEFLQHDIPEGEHARSLTMMMMGMSGMMPMDAPAGLPPQAPLAALETAEAPAAPIPPEVLDKIREGDVAGLAGLLREEHARRSGEPAAAASVLPAPGPASVAPAAASAPRAGIDAAIIDELIRIAADNQVTVDWLMLRAVKLYVEEHRRTGRL